VEVGWRLVGPAFPLAGRLRLERRDHPLGRDWRVLAAPRRIEAARV